MKRRSRTHREGRRKDEAAEIQKEKVASPFQVKRQLVIFLSLQFQLASNL